MRYRGRSLVPFPIAGALRSLPVRSEQLVNLDVTRWKIDAVERVDRGFVFDEQLHY